jgi:ribosomal protein S18 acetylase RimI-like enzyme
MLGVSEHYKGRGLGLHMVKSVIGQARAVSKEVGCRFVTVDSDPTPAALGLYEKAGFKHVPGQTKRETVSAYFDLGTHVSAP